MYSDIRCGYINELTQINWKKMNYLAASCGELDPKRRLRSCTLFSPPLRGISALNVDRNYLTLARAFWASWTFPNSRYACSISSQLFLLVTFDGK